MIELYTDGSTLKNPGQGGWATIIIENGNRTVLQGSDPHTTNNRMEIQAAISGLSQYQDPTEFTIYCDSAYIINCFTQKWYVKWRKNGWMNSMGKPVENQDLWNKLLALCEKHNVKWQKVKGHADNEIHNECDVLAREAAKNKINEAKSDGISNCDKPRSNEHSLVGTQSTTKKSGN